ncbi:MAG: hypothetical protein K8R36_14260, partial [Planctomycetales bacterium]|nr:hypothetical protein [Planctomycetales bacterium]
SNPPNFLIFYPNPSKCGIVQSATKTERSLVQTAKAQEKSFVISAEVRAPSLAHIVEGKA